MRTLTRTRAVLLLLALAGVLWAIASQDWVPATADPSRDIPGVAEVTSTRPRGSGASDSALTSVLTACAAVTGVGALLVVMLGRVGRWVVCGLVAACGLGYAVLGVTTLAGGAGSPWPALGILAGLLAAGGAVSVGLSGNSWTERASRYEVNHTEPAAGSSEAAEDDDDIDPTRAWDDLTRGDDPTRR
ncbi:Trp biosynthesis-associated membrane protein [Brevibacterium litoralis]|uniref:Trp biosynthesis-associated membrane protein n=1 Tax=Brevibacterium litoralis TaxID=3138935 RepID=UPI0032EE3C17